MRKIHLIQKDISTTDISKSCYHKNHQKSYKKRIQRTLLVGGSFVLLLSAAGCGSDDSSEATVATATTSVTTTTEATTTEEVIQATEITFTATPESLTSEEELITFLTNREEEIKTILNDNSITELPLAVQTSLKEEIDFIWYEKTMAGFTYSSLTNETKTTVLDIYSETKKLVEEKYPDYSSEYTIHFIKTNTDLQAQYQAILDAVEGENQGAVAEATASNKPTATTATNKPAATTATNKPGKTTAATTAATTTAATAATTEDSYPLPSSTFFGGAVYDANGNIITYYDDGYYVYQYSEVTDGYWYTDKRDMSQNNSDIELASEKTFSFT